jgi:ABC-type polysaccharide/polyol phosphate transport system ATPase subunit
MSSEDTLIEAQGLAKRYEMYARPEDRLKQLLLPPLQRLFGRTSRRYFHEFWALQDVSFTVRRGETIGIIGRNGAGKSTLLQMIAGTLLPTRGSVQLRGRVCALLELGAGFNPDFSGRENACLYGVLLGLGREEIRARLPAIHDFSGIGRYLDEPVKTYSSGMYARLAFSVAVHCDPALLIVDESLSVGDMEFQERSITRMKQIRDAGTSILFVTHSIPTVRNFCERALWLDDGRVRLHGDSAAVCRAYLDDVRAQARRTAAAGAAPVPGPEQHASGRPKTVFVRDVRVDRDVVAVGGDLRLSVDLGYADPQARFGVGVLIHDEAGRLASVLNTVRDDIFLDRPSPCVHLDLSRIALPPGTYFVSVSICDHNAMFSYDLREQCASFQVAQEVNRLGIPRWEGGVASSHDWVW